jgi:hypothetical protein
MLNIISESGQKNRNKITRLSHWPPILPSAKMKDKMWKTRGILTALPEEVFCLNSVWFKNGTLLSHRAMHYMAPSLASKNLEVLKS